MSVPIFGSKKKRLLFSEKPDEDISKTPVNDESADGMFTFLFTSFYDLGRCGSALSLYYAMFSICFVENNLIRKQIIVQIL